MSGVKFADEGIVEGLGVPFGSPDRRDAHGEYFDARTDLGLDWFPTDRPLLLHHGVGEAGPTVIGRVVAVERRPEGVWVKAVLDRAGKFFGRVRDMLEQGALSFSSGTMAHLIQRDSDGHIARWPLIEMSLTRTPASPDAQVYSVKASEALAHFAAIGLPASGLKGLLGPDPDLLAIRDRVDLTVERQRFRDRELAVLFEERDQFYRDHA